MAYRYDYGYHRRRRDVGREIARRHIEQAAALTRLLGGTDQDVKEYFFGLPPHMRAVILGVYGREYGEAAANYARETIRLWRSGKVTMSGMVAERLFRLLPRFMDLPQKYGLVQRLWKHYSPRSSYQIKFGPKATRDEVVSVLSQHLDRTVRAYRVPDPLERRFLWLSEGDVTAYQQLLNHFLQQDRELVIAAIEAEIGVVLGHASDLGRYVRALTVGGHHIDIVFDPRQSGAAIAPSKEAAPATAISQKTEGIGCWVIIGIIVLPWAIEALNR